MIFILFPFFVKKTNELSVGTEVCIQRCAEGNEFVEGARDHVGPCSCGRTTGFILSGIGSL